MSKIITELKDLLFRLLDRVQVLVEAKENTADDMKIAKMARILLTLLNLYFPDDTGRLIPDIGGEIHESDLNL